MPTIVTHTAVPIALRIALGGAVLSTPLTIAAAVASVVPDLDVVSFSFGIPYGHPLGHRGVSHSLAFAVLLGVIAAVAAPWLRSSRLLAFVVVAFSAASHGLLDAATTGGKGRAPGSVHDAALLLPLASDPSLANRHHQLLFKMGCVSHLVRTPMGLAARSVSVVDRCRDPALQPVTDHTPRVHINAAAIRSRSSRLAADSHQ